MSLDFTKVVYVDGETVIAADNLNDIQDAILELDDEKYEKPSGGIPSSDLNSSAQAMLLPSGGTVGQVLSKKSSSNYDVEWADGGSGGTSDYTDLTNKPQINSHTLTGNQSAADLGLGTYSKPSGGIPDTDLSSAVQASLAKADTALQTAPVTSVNNKTGAVSLSASDVGAYSIPSGGIPDTDLSSSVQASLGKADTAYQKPSGGIPDTDLSAAVQTSLGKADTALQTAPVSSVDGKTGAVTVLPSGGSSGQVLKKNSSTDYDVFWGNESGGGGGGTSDYLDLSNKPQINSVTLTGNLSASDIGVIAEPSSPSSGDVLTYNGSAWGAAAPSHEIPSGGSDGQMLVKDGSTNYATKWANQPTIPTSYASDPAMDGTASPGSTGYFADGGHVHPTDTSRLSTSGDGSNVTVAFSAASTRANISTGEKLSVLMGKIAKWFGDLGTAAFRAATSSIASASTDLIESGAVYTGLAGKAASDLGVSGASANQFVKITAVDGSGKPTAFGASTAAEIDLGISGASTSDMIKVSTVDGSGKPTAWAKAVSGTDYQTPYSTTTLTIATSDWSNNSASKTVNGMTATALVFLEFSDTTTVYTVAQSTDTLTFTVSAAPSSAVTVKVGWFV